MASETTCHTFVGTVFWKLQTIVNGFDVHVSVKFYVVEICLVPLAPCVLCH